ncbi:MFS general substrate transporter [Jaminaea rosea]|uniref:MFS general substrate transporter n=1 Tax=Jaminaea rosea TaxID=1569628 RepID=A0A316UL30_9BASI|nr:MFS general substrate transporter [Jaminaea rosea]PWN25644.1 MFS general substrate transporter [Jaminaea rosea]
MSPSSQQQPAPAYAPEDDINVDEKASGNSSPSPDQPRGTTGAVTVEGYVSDSQRRAQAGYYAFRWSSLYQPAVVNPINGKSHTFPILRFWDTYSTQFWLATLGFFVAFFGWFAAAALMTEAIKVDLKLTPAQVADSNLASLGGTAFVRVIAGYAIDRYGPRKVMAILLCMGAIPTALMPVVHHLPSLKAIRFFISILGGTFVPCQSWTTTFFDKNIVGTANAFSGGWGNMGGGVTPAVMIGLYERLRKSGYTQGMAWRLSFVVLPVPLLFVTAAVIMIFGKDHPAGKWSQRHQLAGTAYEVAAGRAVHLDHNEVQEQERMRNQAGGENGGSNEKMLTSAAPVKGSDFSELQPGQKYDQVDTAVSEPLTPRVAVQVLTDLRVWLCAVSYLLSFGLETAMDAALPQLLFGLFGGPTFTAEDAAFAAATYGLLNLIFRPAGGVFADMLYSKYKPLGYGLRAKVMLMIVTNIMQGLLMVGLGMYVNHSSHQSIGGVIGFIVGIAATGFVANAGAYSVYSHLRPRNIGFVAGLVGSGGAVGGLCYTGLFKTQPGTKAARTLGNKFWIAGVVNIAGILLFSWVPMGDAA